MDWIYSKTVVITGASSGIGRELALKLIRDHECFVIGIGQTEHKMEDLKNELGYQSGSFRYEIFDVSSKEAWEKFARQIDNEEIDIDILVNNAGMMPPFDRAVSYTEEQFLRCMDVNFNGCRYAVNNMLPILRRSTTPAIINVSASCALSPVIGTSAYSAAKAALKAYTECLIGELGREMYVSYVCPGLTATDIFRNQYAKPDGRLLRPFSKKPENIATKMIKKIIKQKSRIIIGKDAKFMNFMSKFFPITEIKLNEQIIKHSKVKMFENLS